MKKEINPTIKKILRVAILVLIFVAVIAIDLATKYYICKRTSTGERIYFIKGVIEFTYSENTGASFGIFKNNTLALTVVSIIAAGLMMAYLLFAKKSHFLLQISLVMFVSGAIGNIYDRIKFGYVRDFIDYTLTNTLFKYQFAICNFADAILVIACILLMVYVIFFYNKHYEETHPKKEIVTVINTEKEQDDSINHDENSIKNIGDEINNEEQSND